MFSTEEQELIMRVRELGPFQKIEIRLLNNEYGKVIVTTTTTERLEISQDVV